MHERLKEVPPSPPPELLVSAVRHSDWLLAGDWYSMNDLLPQMCTLNGGEIVRWA
jgi:hypothetical protein